MKFLGKNFRAYFCAGAVSISGSPVMKITNPGQWIDYTQKQMRGEQSTAKIKMEIKTENWERTMELESHNLGTQKSMVFIQSPPKEKGIGTLRLELKMWNYFPKLKRTIVVSPSMLLSSWMGSDFTNDDLLKASSFIDDYDHSYLEEKSLSPVVAKVFGELKKEEGELQIIHNKAKTNSKVIWSEILFLLSKKDCLPRAQLYLDREQNLKRTLYLKNVKKFDGHMVPSLWVLKPHDQSDKETKIEYTDLKFTTALKSEDFNLQKLSK